MVINRLNVCLDTKEDKSLDRGAVTAEFAVVLPCVVLVAALLLCLVRTVTVSISCQEAAGAAVRELIVISHGEASQYIATFDMTSVQEIAESTAQRIAGEDSFVSVELEKRTVTVTAQCPVVPDPLHVLPTQVTGKAIGVLQ